MFDLPDVPFIAVFGTSHSYGSCQFDGKTEIEENEIWATVVGKQLGYPVVNFGTPGISNFTIIQQILDFLNIENSKNCVLALLEVRQRERLFILSADVGNPAFKILKHNFQPELVSGKYYRMSDKFKNTHSISILQKVDTSIPVFNDVSKNEEVYERILRARTFIEDEIIPNSILTSLNTRAAFEREFNIGSISQQSRDLYHIRTMVDILKLRNIPSKWFTMDLFIGKKDENEKEYDTLLEKFGNISEFSNNVVGSLKYGAYHMYEKEKKQTPPICDCGHYRPDFHQWVATKVYKEVKDIIV